MFDTTSKQLIGQFSRSSNYYGVTALALNGDKFAYIQNKVLIIKNLEQFRTQENMSLKAE